jgi:hypothetical protein
MSLEVSLIMLVAPGLLLLMFLPTLAELRKPRDAGPRLISFNLVHSPVYTSLVDLEEAAALDGNAKLILNVLFATLPKMD